MFEIDTDKTISITRGDSVSFVAPIDYALQPGDVLRLKVFRKKACEDVVLQKDFAIEEATETVTLELTEKDTRIGGVISKPVDYWYEIELNPDNNPKTLVGYDEDGAKIFRLYPEGRDLEDDELTKEEADTFRKLIEEMLKSIEIVGGEDGVSITSVEQTTISTADGGNNVITVTLSDGQTSTFTVKNGSKGSQGIQGEKGDKGDTGATGPKGDKGDKGDQGIQGIQGEQGVQGVQGVQGIQGEKGDKGDTGSKGADGKDGKTPVKGTDYFTEADKTEMVNDVKNVCVAKNQGSANVGKILVVGTDGNLILAEMPEGGASGDVIGTLDESNNILLSGNLADGTYTLKYENADGTYTDVGTLEVGAIVAEPTNLFVVGGDGYIESGRCSSTGADRTDTTSGFVTNYIDVAYGDTVYIKGYQTPTANNPYCGVKYADGSTGGFLLETDTTLVKDFSLTNGVAQFTINAENADYVRFTINKPSSLDDIVITVERGTTPEEPDTPEEPEVIINQIPISTDASGNLFVGTNGEKGYKTDYRLSLSSGGETAATDYECTGFIPAKQNDVIRIKNIDLTSENATNIIFYNSDKTPIKGSASTYGLTLYGFFVTSGTEENGVYTSTLDGDRHNAIETGDLAYIRIGSKSITDESILTVNQEIV